MTTTVSTIDELKALAGTHLGWSDWHGIDQEQVNLFADATGDHQWIHVDPERAATGPFGATIAHGYLTLSIIPSILHEVIRVQGFRFGVNYGCNKVRFPSPLKVGSKARLGAAVESVEAVGDNGAQAVLDITVETEGSDKPACVAQVVYRYTW